MRSTDLLPWKRRSMSKPALISFDFGWQHRQDEARDRDLHFRQPVLSATDNSSPSDERRAISLYRRPQSHPDLFRLIIINPRGLNPAALSNTKRCCCESMASALSNVPKIFKNTGIAGPQVFQKNDPFHGIHICPARCTQRSVAVVKLL